MATFYPSLRYQDPQAALEWLEAAFGFEPREVHKDDSGTIRHAEMSFGGSLVMFGADSGDDRWGKRAGAGWCYVGAKDLDMDAHYETAKAAGAEIVMEPVSTDYGSRDYSARDLEGNLWSFGTYEP